MHRLDRGNFLVALFLLERSRHSCQWLSNIRESVNMEELCRECKHKLNATEEIDMSELCQSCRQKIWADLLEELNTMGESAEDDR